MTTKAEKAEAARLARETGWNSDNFRYREDGLGNLFVSQRGWIGEEALLVKLSALPELLENLKASLADVPDEDEPEDEPEAS